MAAVLQSEAISSPEKPFVFVLGVQANGVGVGVSLCRKDVSLLKSFCAKKMPHIVSRVMAVARWSLFSPSIWFLNGSFAHSVRFEHELAHLFM